jgi:hypothetical protein
MKLIEVVALALLLAAPAAGCKKSEPAAPGATTTKAQPAAPAAAAPAAAAKPAAPAAAKNAPAADPAAAAKAPVVEPAADPTAAAKGDKDVLAKAYVEIYCAQRAGKSEELLQIYGKYGFQEPKAWTVAWTEAAKDEAWVARITQDAIRACP